MKRKPNYRGWIFTNKTAIYTHYGDPLYNDTIGLAEEPLLYTIRNKLTLVIKTKLGDATYENPKVWLEGKTGGGFFRNPNKPIKFYYRSILPDIKKREERKKWEKKLNTEGSLLEALKKIKEKKPDLFKAVQEKLFVNTS
jgi:hypothetical protein